MESGKRIAAVLAVLIGVLFAGTATASAANQRIDIDIEGASVFQSGGMPPSYIGFPATVTRSNPLHLSGAFNPDGSFTIPGEQFHLPILAPSAPMSISFGAAGDLTGTYDVARGEMRIEIPASYRMTMVGSGPDSSQACEISGFQMSGETDGELDAGTYGKFSGSTFRNGFGEVLADWSTPVSALTIKGVDGTPDGNCTSMSGDPVANFAGSLWFEASAEIVDLAPPVPPITTRASLKPGKKTLRAGRSTPLRLQVENNTDTRRNIKVALKSSNRKVAVKKSIVVNVPARAALLTSIKVKAAKTAKGKAKITATADGQKSTSTITVKKSKKRRR